LDARIPHENVVKVRGAGVRRDGRWLVEGIDLAIRRGEIVTLIGPNGSGKSTTAKIVTGVLKPDVGTVERARHLTVGYVPQKLSIDWTLPLTVRRLMTLTGSHSRGAVTSALGGDLGSRSGGDRAPCRCRGAAPLGRRVPTGAPGARHDPPAGPACPR
jgi:zinc transport system ATP-binding protein